MKKISLAQAALLLTQAGVANVEIVIDDKDADKDVKTDDLLADIDKSRLDVLRPRLEDELKPEIEKAVTGRLSGTFRSAIKRVFKGAGITESDIKDIEKEEDALKLCLDKHNEKYSKDTEDLRKEMEKMAETHGTALETLTAAEQKKYEELQGKYVDRDIKDTLLGIVSKIPKVAGDPLFQTEAYMNWLKQNYHVVYDEKLKEVGLRKLDNKELPAYNESGTAQLTPKELAQTYFEKSGALVKDNRHKNPSDTLPENNNNNNNNSNAVIVDPTSASASVDAMKAYLEADV